MILNIAPQNIFDSICETCASPGVGTVTLLGAKPTFNSFSSVCTNGMQIPYRIADQNGSNFEIGVGIWNTGGTLTRVAANVITGSAGAGVLVNFNTGVQDVSLTLPAEYVSQPSYWQDKCALLEPDAIEPIQYGTFSYNVPSGSHKWITASFDTNIGGSGLCEVRNPQDPQSISNLTLNGNGSTSAAVILNPNTPIYSNPQATYYSRLQQLWTNPFKQVLFNAGAQILPFLPGAYGAIILRCCVNWLDWISLQGGGLSWGLNLGNENGNVAAQAQNMSQGLLLAVNKLVCSEADTGAYYGSGTALGGISYYLVPSTWSVVADPLAPYDFRDDFMGASLNVASTWVRAQSTIGNVEINPIYQWCALKGDGTFAHNSMHTQVGYARVTNRVMLADIYVGRPSVNNYLSSLICGLSDGLGLDYTNFAHGVNFSWNTGPVAALAIYENGTFRGFVGSGYTIGAIYRLRFTLTSTGCKYEIQGGPQYPAIGSNSWTNITPGTTNSTTATLYPGAAISDSTVTCYWSDPRVYG